MQAAQAGDVTGAVAAPLQGTPEYRAYLHDVARSRIARARQEDHPTAPVLRWEAAASVLLDDYDEAIALLQQAIRSDERLRPDLLIDLEQHRAERRKASAAEATGAPTP